MTNTKKRVLLVGQSGGPTAVIICSWIGVYLRERLAKTNSLRMSRRSIEKWSGFYRRTAMPQPGDPLPEFARPEKFFVPKIVS